MPDIIACNTKGSRRPLHFQLLSIHQNFRGSSNRKSSLLRVSTYLQSSRAYLSLSTAVMASVVVYLRGGTRNIFSFLQFPLNCAFSFETQSIRLLG